LSKLSIKATEDRDLHVRFPTKEDKAKREGKEVAESAIYTYWTDFDRRNPGEYRLSTAPDSRPLMPAEIDAGWWVFQTNLSWHDLDKMDKARLEIFLKQMWEIYRYRKVNSETSSRS